MNYKKLYDSLIESAKQHPKSDIYKELHHIIPLCMGGCDSYNNLIKLTARQHYLAHWLLYKIYKTTKLAHAWYGMSRISKGQSDRKLNSHLFERAKIARSKVMSETSRGTNNHFYGKRHSAESNAKNASAHLGKIASDVTKEKMSKTRSGVLKSEDHKAKIGRKGLIMLKNSITNVCVRVPSEDIVLYDIDIWKSPYVLRDKKYGSCPHCKKEGELSSTFKRWHFDNCKNRSIE